MPKRCSSLPAVLFQPLQASTNKHPVYSSGNLSNSFRNCSSPSVNTVCGNGLPKAKPSTQSRKDAPMKKMQYHVRLGMASAVTLLAAFAFAGCAQDDKDRKSTRLNSSHVSISYAVFCLKKKKKKRNDITC